MEHYTPSPLLRIPVTPAPQEPISSAPLAKPGTSSHIPTGFSANVSPYFLQQDGNYTIKLCYPV